MGNTTADRTAFNNTFPPNGAILKFTSATAYDLYASPVTSSSKPVSSGTLTGSTANASGVNFTVSGTPAAGDQFVVESGTHQTENILNTLTAAIKALSTPVDGNLVASQKLDAALGSALGNIASSIDQASTARSAGVHVNWRRRRKGRPTSCSRAITRLSRAPMSTPISLRPLPD